MATETGKVVAGLRIRVMDGGRVGVEMGSESVGRRRVLTQGDVEALRKALQVAARESWRAQIPAK